MQALRRTLGFASQATARKPRVVVLGSGWGGNKVARYLDKSKFDVRVVSPANHFLFTPLLPSTAVGTLEFRAVQEPVRTIKGLGKYHQAKAQTLDVENRIVNCRDIFSGDTFDINYDFLVISAGCKTNTFAVPGVTQEQQSTVFFLKHLYHARRIGTASSSASKSSFSRSVGRRKEGLTAFRRCWRRRDVVRVRDRTFRISGKGRAAVVSRPR